MSTAPFRITRAPKGEIVEKTLVGRASADLGPWMERLIKLVPSEVVALYLAGRAYATNWEGLWAPICLAVLLVIRVMGTKPPGPTLKGVQWWAVAISSISFVIWVYAMGGHFLDWVITDPGIPSAAVLIWTVVIPILYKGD